MRYSVFILLALVGCTSDNYSPSDAGMKDALYACKKEANDKFYAENSPFGGVGAGVAGVFGGGIGGALVGLASAAATPDTKMKAADVNPYVENCMKNRGYEGTSVDATM